MPPTGFAPAVFQREFSMHLEGTPDEVFDLFGPESRVKSSVADVLFPGFDEEKEGMAYHSPHGNTSVFSVVVAHDADAHLIRYVHMEGFIEILVEEIRVTANSQGETVAKIRWVVWGLSEEGNEAVRRFMTERFETMMKQREKAANDTLRNGRE